MTHEEDDIRNQGMHFLGIFVSWFPFFSCIYIYIYLYVYLISGSYSCVPAGWICGILHPEVVQQILSEHLLRTEAWPGGSASALPPWESCLTPRARGCCLQKFLQHRVLYFHRTRLSDPAECFNSAGSGQARGRRVFLSKGRQGEMWHSLCVQSCLPPTAP